ncbi:MAG: PilX N-terminal domain-containing pilus assembly protein [Desulfococcaceae bacterium]
MEKRSHCRSREDGFVLVVAMLVMIVLTVIGIAATQTSIFEIMLSNAEKKKQAAFYAAEAGLEHGRVLVEPLIPANIDYDPTDQEDLGSPPSLSFLLDGTISGWNAAGEGDRFENGVVIVQDETIGDGYTYNVRILNNRADPDADEDTDGFVILASVATKPNGGASRVEIGLKAFVSDFTEQDYTGQDHAGPTKSSSNTDSDTVNFRTGNNANQARGNYQVGG